MFAERGVRLVVMRLALLLLGASGRTLDGRPTLRVIVELRFVVLRFVVLRFVALALGL